MMNRFINQFKDYLSDIDIIDAAYIFGSMSKGTEKRNSDVDVAILTNNVDLDFELKLKISDDLEALCGRQIDLIVLSEASCILQYQVIKYGELILVNNKAALSMFKVRTSQEYIDLKQLRLPIERHMKDVSIYG